MSRTSVRSPLARMAILLSGVACVAAGCGIGSLPESTWDDLEEVASTYPVPPQLQLTSMERQGDLCQRPDCADPRVALEMEPIQSVTADELCAILERSLDEWPGYERADRQTEELNVCSITGEVDGFTVTATTVSSAESLEGDGPLVIVAVFA